MYVCICLPEDGKDKESIGDHSQRASGDGVPVRFGVFVLLLAFFETSFSVYTTAMVNDFGYLNY